MEGPSQNATPYDLLLESLDLMLTELVHEFRPLGRPADGPNGQSWPLVQELAALPAVAESHACECGGGHHHAEGHPHAHAHVNGTEVNHAG